MLRQKMIREIGKNKMQFFSIILLAFLGVFVYAGVSAMGYGLKESYESYFAESNYANYWIYGAMYDEEDVEKVADIEEVKEAERKLVVSTELKGNNTKSIELNVLDENKVSLPVLAEGEEFDLASKDGVWLDKRFADANKYKVGDSLSLIYENVTMDFVIKGTIYNPEYMYFVEDDAIYPDFEKMGFAYCPENAVKESELLNKAFYSVIIMTSDCEDKDFIEDKIDEALDGKYAIILQRDEFVNCTMVTGEFDSAKAMCIIFPIVFAVVSLLTIVITMRRMIRKQRTLIGTFKALGFKNGVILKHYLEYGFWTSFIGGALGVFCGPNTLPAMFWPSYQTTYTLPEWKADFQPLSVVIAIAFVVFCTLSVYVACKGILTENAAQALRPETPKLPKASRLANTRWWKKRSFYTQWAIRDLSRSKLKTFMGVVGTLGCMALLVCAFLCNDSINSLKEANYSKIIDYDYEAYINKTIAKEDVQKAVEEVDGETLLQNSIVIKASEDTNDKKTVVVTVLENGASDLYHVLDTEWNTMELKDGQVAVSQQLANTLGVAVGDKVYWHLYTEDEWIESEVAVLNRVPMGQGIWMTKKTYEECGYEYIPMIAMTDKDISAYAGNAFTRVYGLDEMIKAWDSGMLAMTLLVILLIIAAIILVFIVLYNIGLFSFMESQKEFALLRVTGFKTKHVCKILRTQNMWLALVGVIIGIPVGYAMMVGIVQNLGDDYDFALTVQPISVVISMTITLVVAYLVSIFFSKKIKKLDLVQESKAVE